MDITQKRKFIILREILIKKTDDTHMITLSDIICEFDKMGIPVERKSLYRDIKELNNTGIKIKGVKKGREYYYQVIEKEFKFAELKLLVDAIQSSKFITIKKSKELIKKLEAFVSDYEAKKLDGQIYIQGRIKSMNESIYHNIDYINEAINNNKQIVFKYMQWNELKKLEYKHGGKDYRVSPWELVWNNEYYYLIGYDHNEQKIKHFRIDKMLIIDLLDEKREGKKLLNDDNTDYSKAYIGMFGGERRIVKILTNKDKLGIFLDKFGKEILIKKSDNGNLELEIPVIVINLFLGWIFGLGENVKIIGPEDVVSKYKKEVKRVMYEYK